MKGNPRVVRQSRQVRGSMARYSATCSSTQSGAAVGVLFCVGVGVLFCMAANFRHVPHLNPDSEGQQARYLFRVFGRPPLPGKSDKPTAAASLCQ